MYTDDSMGDGGISGSDVHIELPNVITPSFQLVVMGTPAEEGGGGKIRLLELGAFEDIDAAMMVHPTKYTHLYPNTLCNTRYSVTFKGKESHALMSWKGLNSLDAAVTCYMSISQLRQHIKSSSKIQAQTSVQRLDYDF
ncbi:UNVERIFIED_CONTAM: Pm20d2 [Trichonephila clavipes]